MVQPTNTDAIAKATDRSWEDWIELLDDAGARDMTHASIADLALELMPETVSQKEWWAQNTAVAFGKYAGLRVPGQTSDGDFQLSTSRTVPGSKDEAFQAWLKVVESCTEFDGVPIKGEPATSQTEKWRYWRARLADGTRVTVNISDKANGKATLGLQHAKLDSPEAIDRWRPVWKDLLAQL
jgi:hypothetical protein